MRRVPLIVWIFLFTAIVIGVGVWFFSKNQSNSVADSGKPVAVSNPVPGTQEYSIVDRNHVPAGTTVTNYNSNPPTSGSHWFTSDPKWQAPMPKGIYDTTLFDEQLVHNLEHGYIWISYKSDLSDDAKNKIKDIIKADDWKIVMEPRDKNDSEIALAAWGRLLKMDQPDYDKIKAFITTYRNRGPENTPD